MISSVIRNNSSCGIDEADNALLFSVDSAASTSVVVLGICSVLLIRKTFSPFPAHPQAHQFRPAYYRDRRMLGTWRLRQNASRGAAHNAFRLALQFPPGQ